MLSTLHPPSAFCFACGFCASLLIVVVMNPAARSCSPTLSPSPSPCPSLSLSLSLSLPPSPSVSPSLPLFLSLSLSLPPSPPLSLSPHLSFSLGKESVWQHMCGPGGIGILAGAFRRKLLFPWLHLALRQHVPFPRPSPFGSMRVPGLKSWAVREQETRCAKSGRAR